MSWARIPSSPSFEKSRFSNFSSNSLALMVVQRSGRQNQIRWTKLRASGQLFSALQHVLIEINAGHSERPTLRFQVPGHSRFQVALAPRPHTVSGLPCPFPINRQAA